MKRKNLVKQAFPTIGFTLLLLYTLSFLIPLLWVFFTSFKDRLDFALNPFNLPETWHFENYSQAFKKLKVPIQSFIGTKDVYLWELIKNSLVYAVGCTISHTLVPALTAYVVAKYKFRLGKIIYATVIITMLLPIVGSLPSELQLTKYIGFYDNMVGLWLMKGNFLGVNFLILYAAFKSLPNDFSEAAVVDGASHTAIMFKIMLPLAATTISAIALLNFISFWNDYTTPMIYLPSSPTVAYGLFRFQFSPDNEISSVPMQLTGCMIVFLPMFVLFMLFKNKLMGNLTMGGIKG